MDGRVVAVAMAAGHGFSKRPVPGIDLVAGIGVAGDAHAGVTVKHRSRVAVDPTQPNLRQVHLLAVERLEEMAAAGFDVAPGAMGENVTTRGIDLEALPRGARLGFPGGAVVTVTGLRNPCAQIEAYRAGLLAQVLHRDGDRVVRRAGIMGVVEAGGPVVPGDGIVVELPPGPPVALERV